MSPSIWIGLVEKVGLSTALVLAIVWIFYKKIIPDWQRQAREGRELLMHLLKDSTLRMDKQAEEFIKALGRRDDVMREEFQRLHDKLDGRTRRKTK